MREKPQRGARKIVVNDETWWWLTTHGSMTVVIWNPDGKKFVEDKRVVGHIAQGNYDPFYGTTKEVIAVTPRDVKDHIVDNLLWEPFDG